MGWTPDALDTDMHPSGTLTSYCFGDLPDGEREQVEQHLMICDGCWEEFRRLDAAVRTLRHESVLGPVMPVDEIVSVLGWSSRLDRPFGGHAWFAISVAMLYGLEWTVGLWSELGYSYDRFGGLAWVLSAPVAASVSGAVLFSLWAAIKSVRSGQVDGLVRSAALILTALGLVTVCLTVVLPGDQTIQASFQTRSAAGGYFKDALLIFLPLLLFILPPFHTVVSLQRYLKAGRHRQVEGALAASHDRIAPRGVWYLSPRVLTGFLVVMGTLKIVGTNHMLDALTPGPYANLFSVASYIGTGLWFAIAAVCLIWYSISLNELRREARALAALQDPQAQERPH
jgi:anti-sigma factor RsiW